MESVLEKALSINFFEYPSTFVIPEELVTGFHTPYSSYLLSITSGTRTHSVSWIDDKLTVSTYAEADLLRDLMSMILHTISSHPEVEELPASTHTCI
jgi:hypothetical protein